MWMAVVAVIVGLIFLVWGADRFVEGAVGTAGHFGMPPLLIGMVIVGFGTSAPEMVVSALAALQGNPGIALGNAYGSNIANIALILGITALISPIMVHSAVLRRELPILTLVTTVSIFLVVDLRVSMVDAVVLLVLFAGLMGWTIVQGIGETSDSLARDVTAETAVHLTSLKQAVLRLAIGLVLLTLSLFIIGYGFRGRQGRINRLEGAGLLAAYLGYTFFLIIPILTAGQS